MTQATTVASGFAFLEAPRWHDDRVWFSDFYTHQVLLGAGGRHRTCGPRRRAAAARGPGVAAGRAAAGGVDARCKVLRREPDGTLVTHADLGGHVTGHANDMVVDAAGPRLRRQLRLRPDERRRARDRGSAPGRPDGTVTEVADDLWFPNGSVITPLAR